MAIVAGWMRVLVSVAILGAVAPPPALAAEAVTVVRFADAPNHRSPDGLTLARLLLGPASGRPPGGLHVGSLILKRGAAVAKHSHAESDEIVVLLKGEVEMIAGGEIHQLKAPLALLIPRGVEHSFRVIRAAEAVQIYSPAGPEARFKVWPEAG